MSKIKGFSWGLLAFLILSLGLVACGDTAAAQPAAVNANPAAVSQVSQNGVAMPAGSYITTLKAKDFHPEFIEGQPALRGYIGRWELQFADASRFSIKVNNRTEVEGTYTLTADELFLTSAKWPSLSETYVAPATASYHWQLDSSSKALNLLGKSDPHDITAMALLMHELVPVSSPAAAQ
jgi:hypothetical protein